MDAMIPDKDEIITALEHVIIEQKAEIESLEIRIKHLERQLADASWTNQMYRDQSYDPPRW